MGLRGVRVQGLEFGVSGLMVWGLGFGVSGLRGLGPRPSSPPKSLKP